MLRFRPIAPKPTGGEPASVTAEQGEQIVVGRRVKRKYVRRVRGRQRKSKFSGEKQPSPPEKSGVEEAPPPEKGAAAVPLLGEMRSGSDQRNIIPETEKNRCSISYTMAGGRAVELGGGGRSVMETSMIVECVTEKYTGEVRLGFSDKEKIYNLEKDTCPGFVSDCTNNVIWANQAYKKMVAEKGFLVPLVVKEQLPHFCPSFACRVRVTQQKGQGQKWNKIVPCDVWRMEFGGFAWKLDVNTALSLGL